MRLTIPQIIMLNHGAHINQLRSDARIEERRKQQDKEEQNPPVFMGKRADELNSEEMAAYFGSQDDGTIVREL